MNSFLPPPFSKRLVYFPLVLLWGITLPLFLEGAPIENQVFQTGPGIVGPLIPLELPRDIKLISENTQIFSYEDELSLVSQYVFKNESPDEILLKVGIPTLLMQPEGLELKDLRMTQDEEELTIESWPGEKIEEAFGQYKVMPAIQRLSLERLWHGTHLKIPAQKSIQVMVRFNLRYLFMFEILGGRKEESVKYFKYQRSLAEFWGVPEKKLLATVTSQVKHTDRFSIFPGNLKNEREEYKFPILNRAPNVLDDIVVVYDPIYLEVTSFGYGGQPVPEVLNNGDQIFGYENLTDGDVKTAFCEGEPQGAEGMSIELAWGKYKAVKGVEIFGAYSPDSKKFREKNRLKEVLLYFGQPGWYSKPIPFQFRDISDYQKLNLSTPMKASLMVIQFKEVYLGSQSDDTCIADVRIHLE